jgi:hypothetical protein
MSKMKKIFLFTTLILASLLLMGSTVYSQPVPVAQFTPYPTPTPGNDGRIVYIAVEGDSAWRIAAIFGFTGEAYNELRTLNNWGDNPSIYPGDEVILGIVSVLEPTPLLGPTPTPAPILPTPSPEPGWGELCILLYNDENGDSMRQGTEASIPGGAFSISSRSGAYSTTADTFPGFDYQCFENLLEGEYSISIAPPEGFNPTTRMSYSIDVKAGEKHYIDFGAQMNSEKVAEMPAPQGEGQSPLLGVVGGVFLLAALVMAGFAWRMLRLK